MPGDQIGWDPLIFSTLDDLDTECAALGTDSLRIGEHNTLNEWFRDYALDQPADTEPRRDKSVKP